MKRASCGSALLWTLTETTTRCVWHRCLRVIDRVWDVTIAMITANWQAALVTHWLRCSESQKSRSFARQSSYAVGLCSRTHASYGIIYAGTCTPAL